MLLATLGLSLWATVTGAAAQNTAKPVLTYGINAGPTTLDPVKTSGFGGGVDPLIFEAPVARDATWGGWSAGLAVSWHWLKTGRANRDFEVTLRHNAHYSDGTPVTAQTIKTFFDYWRKNAPTGITAFGSPTLQTVGKWTLIFHLKVPLSYDQILDAIAGLEPSCPASVAKPSLMATATCGAGPYEVDPSETVTGDHYTLVPNPYYYDKAKIKWSKIIVRIIPSPSSLLQAMRSGQIDVGAGDPSTVAQAAAARFTIEATPATNMIFTLDVKGTKAPALADLRVRQALNYAINRRVLARAFVGKYGTPSDELRTLDGWDPKYADHYPYNPAKARALLAAAGYGPGHGLTVDSVASGFSGSLGTPLAQAVAQELKAVGVTLKVQSDATPGSFDQDAEVNPFPVVEIDGFGVCTAGPCAYTLLLQKGAPLNKLGGGWDDPNLDHLFLKGQTDTRSRSPYPKQLMDRSVTQADYLEIFTMDALMYVNSKYVKNVVVGTDSGWVSMISWLPS